MRHILRSCIHVMLNFFVGNSLLHQGVKTTIDNNTLENIYFSKNTSPYVMIGCVIPFDFPHVRAAINLALTKVNKDANILHNYSVVPIFLDSGVVLDDPSLTINGFLSLVTQTSRNRTFDVSVASIIGPNIPEHSKAASSIGVALNLPINFISPIVSDPIFSDKKRFPNFARIVPSDKDQATALLSLCQKFQWRKIAILASSSTEGQSISNEFSYQALTKNISVILSLTFSPFPNTSIASQIQAIILSEATIILMAFTNIEALFVFPQLKAAKLFGFPYQFILINQILRTEKVFANNTSFSDILIGSIGTMNAGFDLTDFSNFRNDWANLYKIHPEILYNISEPLIVSRNVFDAVILSCYILDIYDKLSDWCNTNTSNVTFFTIFNINFNYTFCSTSKFQTNQRQFMFEMISKLKFKSTTGIIDINQLGDRIPSYSIMNVQKNNLTQIGFISDDFNVIISEDIKNVVWTSSTFPQDSLPQIMFLDAISRKTFIGLTVLYFLTFCYFLILFLCNCYYNKHKLIKITSPKINYNIFIGLLLSIVLCEILIIPNSEWVLSNENHFVNLNLSEFWLLMGCFTLVFASLFLKTLRVDFIFNEKLANRQTFSDNKILLIICVCLVIDIILSLFYSIFSNGSRYFELYDTLRLDKSIINKYYVRFSTDYSLIWNIVPFVYKGLIVVASIFVSFRIRNVNWNNINDSRSIVFCVYIIAITVCILLPLTLSDVIQQNYLVIIKSVLIWFVATVVASILFLPSFIRIIVMKK